MRKFSHFSSFMGNFLATVLGIVMTFGVSSLITHFNNRKEVKQIMFSVVQSLESGAKFIAKADSLYSVKSAAIDTVLTLYTLNGNSLSNVPDSLLRVSTNKITQLNLSFKAYYPENYFFDITVLHQFNNLHLYGLLSTAIEYDKDSFIILKELYDQNYKIIKSFVTLLDYYNNSFAQAWEKLIQEGDIVDFMHNIDLNLSLFSESNYANIIDMVLYEMDSSKEEYRKYINKQGDKMKEFSFN